MPIAVVVDNQVKFELKSAPPDGFVSIRRMNYGESLKRRDMMANVAMEMRDRKGRDDKETTKIQMEILSEKTAIWEFSNLVMEHNLTDANGSPLNFKNPDHVKMLQGKIGDEIQNYINNLNSFEEDEQVKN